MKEGELTVNLQGQEHMLSSPETPCSLQDQQRNGQLFSADVLSRAARMTKTSQFSSPGCLNVQMACNLKSIVVY
nr:hypothetical protein [Bacillus tequilensis]